MDISPVQFPNQKLTEAQKIKIYGSIEEWGKNTVESLVGIGSQAHYLSYDDTYRKQINYNLLAGYVNEEDFKYVTKPYGLTKFNFPATFTNYNIMTPKISLLEGEEAKRPFNFRIVATDHDSTNEISREKTSAMRQIFQGIWQKELQSIGIDINNQDEVQQNTPQEVEKYFSTSYQSTREINAQKGLVYLIRYLEVQDKFNSGWRDLLVTGEEIYYVGLSSNEPTLESVNPVYFHYDRNPDLKYIEDSAWAYRELYISPADVYDRWGDILTEDQIEKIESAKGGRDGTMVNNSAIGVPIKYTDVDDGSGRTRSLDSTVFVPVIHCEWKGLKKVGFVSWVDESGQEQTIMVDEHYKPNPYNNETIEWRWISTVYEATRVLRDIYVGVREKPNQYRSMDNPNRCKLGYIGVCYNAKNSQPYSLVEIMKPHQYLYNIIMYRLELEIARAQGKKMIFDVAQIPTSEGFDMERWMYYFNVLGIGFINSFEEGKGKFAGQAPTFNQFQAIDLSMARVVDQYVMMLDKIEDMVGEISGVSKQRQGEISSNETVGGVERSVQQSSYITEPLFIAHNMCKQHVLSSLLEVTKLAWSEGKKINFVMDDMTRILLDIDGTEFVNAEYGVFISNNAKDDQILDAVKQLAQAAMQSGQASLMDIVAIMESQNVTKAKQILKDAQEKAQQAAQQQQQHEQELQAQQLQAAQQNIQMQMQAQDEQNKRDNDTKIQVALIQAESQAQAKMPEDKTPELMLKAKEISDKRAMKERELKHKEQLDNAELDHTKNIDNRDLENTKSVDSRTLDHDKKSTNKEIANKKAADDAKIQLDREVALKKLADEKAAAEKKRKDELNLENKKLSQEDIQHQREQETKIEQEKIKAAAAVKVAKEKPTPKPGGAA